MAPILREDSDASQTSVPGLTSSSSGETLVRPGEGKGKGKGKGQGVSSSSSSPSSASFLVIAGRGTSRTLPSWVAHLAINGEEGKGKGKGIGEVNGNGEGKGKGQGKGKGEGKDA
jgi:hypothetical protein